MHTRYFRKKVLDCRPEEIEWVEMSGKEYYRFVTDPRNKNRCFHNMGDVVLECTAEEYKRFKAEDDHSSYILEQEDGWSTISLSVLEQRELVSGGGAIVDMGQDVEERVIRTLQEQELYEILRQLSEQDYRLIYALYLAKPRKTVRQLSSESHIPVMTLENRKLRILRALKKFFQI